MFGQSGNFNQVIGRFTALLNFDSKVIIYFFIIYARLQSGLIKKLIK